MSLANQGKDLLSPCLGTQALRRCGRAARDADILVHEATFDLETGNLAKEYGHSTIMDAAKTAKRAGAKTLIATHISARFLPSDIAQLKKEGKFKRFFQNFM